MSRLPRLQIGRPVPGGPRAVGIPAFGGQLPRGDRQAAGLPITPRADNRSKKHYAGSINGIGRADRARIRQPLGAGGNVPRGPGNAVFPTQLPRRSAAPAPARGSLLNRIGQRLRRAVGL